jgi:hypothetical protein
MADDDAGGTVYGFPGGLTIPGPVGSGPPPPGAAAPRLPDLPELAPPPSLLVAGNSDAGSGGSTTTAHADPGMPDSPEGQGIAAMSVVMMAGITVAAMRGAWNAAAYLKARHEHHRAIADQQRTAADKAALGLEMARQRGRIQSGPEFGRSTRTGGGGGGRTNSGKNSPPATFRSSGGPKPSGGSGTKTPSKTPGGGSGGRTGTLGTDGRGGGGGGRRNGLEPHGTKGGGKTGTTGAKNGSGGLTRAARDRAADRIRNGPAPKSPRPDRSPRIRDAARGRVADRITTGSWKPTGAAAGTKPSKPSKPVSLAKSPATHQTIRGALRGRMADRITTGSWTPTGKTNSKAAAAKTIRGALRGRVVDWINGKPDSAASAQAGPKVDLTKKPKPKPGSGGASGTGGAAPKVDLRKKVNLKKKPRKPGPGKKTGPAGGAGATGPTTKAGKSRSRQGWWERAGARRSERASSGPSGSTGTSTGTGMGGGFGPPPGWGYTQPYTVTVERADGGPGSQVRRRPAGAITRGRPGLPAGTSRGGTVVTVPVPTKAPNTQYADSDLTIYDVIDSDADMAEEIMAGVDEARAAAEGCDKMMTRLEALHAKIVELKVPGVLEGWVLILAEKAVSVKAKAEALAEKLPAASEAIRTAGENAERRHKPLADAVRDAGHAAPAERDYHVE